LTTGYCQSDLVDHQIQGPATGLGCRLPEILEKNRTGLNLKTLAESDGSQSDVMETDTNEAALGTWLPFPVWI
jgi:hypothetical protein